MKFSVCICVYDDDNHKYFKEALESVYFQSKRPEQIVLVVDGPINDNIENIINDFYQLVKNKIEFDVIKLKDNLGHGLARKTCIDNAKYDLIALMDADDVSKYDRFEKQLAVFNEKEDVSIVGGQILEVHHSTREKISIRKVPVSDIAIKNELKSRSPFNQMTVMFKKDEVLEAGNYKQFYHNEDYYLWVRMYLNGGNFYNIPEILVDVRINEKFYGRRGGLKYFKSEMKLQHYMLSNSIIKYPRFFYNISIRFLLQVLFTDSIRAFFFKKFARQRV